MFDELGEGAEDRPSVFEALLRDALTDAPAGLVQSFRPRSTIVLEAPPHGAERAHPASETADPASETADPASETADPASETADPASEAVEPEMAAFAALLEAGAEHLDAARAAHRAQCRQAALQVRALAAFAAARPAATLDRPDGEVGAAAAATRAARPAALTPVSEWAVDEVMVALSLSSQAAGDLLTDSITLVEKLPATVAALEEGAISWAHARMLAEVVAPIADDAVRADVEARLLARAAGKTVSQLRVAARRAVLRADASAAARRLAEAVRTRSVRAFPGKDGMGSLSATMPVPVLRACMGVLEAYAAACVVPEDTRTKEQRMTDCLVDLLLRPDAAGRPPVQAQLTLVASVNTMTGGDKPGEVDGQPIPAELVRELAYTLGLLPRPGSAATDDTGAPAREQAPMPAPDAPADDTVAPARGQASPPPNAPIDDDLAVSSGLADLLRLRSTAGTALTELPQVAVVDEISGQLLALASPTEIRRAATCPRPACRSGHRPCTHPPAGPGLGPPPPTDGYRPTDPMQRFLRARDRRCRFPGCRTPAARCDLDHNRPWPAGSTSCENLCCLCRHHHRLSHQAPGWTMRRLPDGGLEWTTPSGHTITTHPPRYGTDDDLPPPRPHADAGPSLRERVLGTPARPGDEPAPF